jgi:hypothetical protein
VAKAQIHCRAQHYATTVYFDTPTRLLYQRAKISGDNIKLRAREYYDLHPDLTELARAPKELVRYTPVLWIELKVKEAQVTSKRRVGIPKSEVTRFFERGAVSQQMTDIQRAAYGAEGNAVIDELARFRERFDEPLVASVITHYQRKAFQDDAGLLRVTFDRGLACFVPPPNLWVEPTPLVRERLGTPALEQGGFIVEVKTRGPAPHWLTQALGDLSAAPSGFSKFLVASAAAYGE